MTEREQQILSLIRDDPLMPQREIAERLAISRSSVAGHIMNLASKGVIKGRGYVFNNAPYVVVIGGANMDINGFPAGNLSLNDSNPGTVQTSPGGVARNIAENLARLGADCRLMAPVGRDPYGDILLQHGRAAGIDMRYIVQMASAPTSTYVSVLDASGDMHVAISDMSIIDELGPDHLRPHQQMLQHADLIVIDTNLADDALAWLTGTFIDRPLFVDTVSTTKAMKIKPYLASVHTLKPSLVEAEALAGMKLRSNHQLPELAAWFHDRGVERLFVTLGAKGVFYSTGDAQGIEANDMSNNDMSNAGGAGDAFLAGLAYAWLNEWPFRKSLKFSLAAASVTLSHQHSSNPALSLAAVNRVVERQHES